MLSFPMVAAAGWGARVQLHVSAQPGPPVRPVRLVVEPFCAHFWTLTRVRFGQEERLVEGAELPAMLLVPEALPQVAADAVGSGARFTIEAYCHHPYLAGLGLHPRTWWWFVRFWCSALAWRLLFTRRPPTLVATLMLEPVTLA